MSSHSVDFISLISEKISKVQKNEIYYEEIYKKNEQSKDKNEFLFFVKPEITIASEDIKINDILKLILDKIAEFNLSILNIKVLSANYMKEHDIIAQHYGVINKIANDAKGSMSEGAKQKFEELYSENIEKANIFGGLEFIEAVPCFNPLSLNYIWQNSPTEKLAGGTYSQKLSLDGKPYYLVNGFHPQQLNHFIADNRSIVTFTLSGDIDWNVARNDYIGATNPTSATKGSIRSKLLKNKQEFGLTEISASWNGAHLSAGPVEGLVELMRYNSDFSKKDGEKSLKDFSFGLALQKNFSNDQIDKIISNEDVIYKGENISIFDLTEEKNSDEAITLLKEVL